ncbi:sulfurtransferase [Mucilaginibacter robiniae]|uniref:Sulfurtransferase n=1 Tax=Mucilaginibacter robiniae TaxID=2728022 RepID=A0A7L5E145_9SPHI|nr:sulfurtransferase [Mucilaginibacter robiniae]QJD97082.1 sulfurtransferase [Mucilaginibacter robiniae]
MLPLIEIIELQQLPEASKVIIDARGGPDSYERYLQGHLIGALFVDLDKDLAAKPDNPAYGGRHPLPEPQQFAALLGRLGITPQTHVVVYDDKAGANSAARFWWMMKAIGHEKVQVLNGGLQAAIDAQWPLTQDVPQPQATTAYPTPAEFAGTVTIDEAGKAAQSSDRMLIDVREEARYLGQTEPLDLIAGHIPGAVNIFYASNLDASGKYLSAEELRNKYEQAFGGKLPADVVVHCGSGVTACHTLLALEQAGLQGAKLYVGSWSEWSRRDLPIATNEV